MISDTLSIILKYIDDETIKKLFNNTYNICIKKSIMIDFMLIIMK